MGPLVAAALAGGPKGFAPALVAASSAVALGGLLMAVVWISGGNVNRKRKGVGLWR